MFKLMGGSMFLSELRVSDFILQVKTPQFWEDLKKQFKLVHGVSVEGPELNSWKNSLPALAEVLSKTSQAVMNSMVYIEYGMPSSSCRADVLLAGIDPAGRRAAIIFELKQW